MLNEINKIVEDTNYEENVVCMELLKDTDPEVAHIYADKILLAELVRAGKSELVNEYIKLNQGI